MLMAALAALASSMIANAEDQWSWKVAPYVLGPSIDGNASIGRLTGVGIAVDPADIINVLDAGAMIFAEGLHHSGWGAMVDYSFMDLSDSGSFAAGAGFARAGVFQGILTANVFKRLVNAPDRQLDAYAGIRWWNTEVDVNARLGPINAFAGVDESWVDPHIGMRYRQRLNNSDWSLIALGDIGGFGVASDFAWTAEAGAAWQATETFSLEFTYKAIGVDYATGVVGTPSFFSYDTVTHGPKVGFVFEF